MTVVNPFTKTIYIALGGITLTLFVGINLLKSSFVTVNPGEVGQAFLPAITKINFARN